MNVVYTSLEALILKATNASLPLPDEAAVEAFCSITRDAPDGVLLGVQALAVRIHSSHPREALLALSMTDRCMRRCGSSFHAEVGKFRFLNEMIKLVSPKYCACKTAPEVKTLILQILHAWSIEYPKEPKFKVAYDMLKNQGVVKETPPPLPPEDLSGPYKNRPKSAIFDDEEKSKLLQRLLQSKKPEDLQHANRLIKTMVREEERRGEDWKRAAAGAHERVSLLAAMLARASTASADERALIHDLYAGCVSLPAALRRLADAPDLAANELDDILRTYEMLEEVMNQYKEYATSENPTPDTNSVVQATNSESLLDFAGAPPNNEQPIKQNAPKNNVIDDLGDIFTTKESHKAEPLRPVSLMPNDLDEKADKKNKQEGWNNLDSLGEQLLKESLPANAKRVDNFKTTKKVPMNALEKISPKKESQTLNNSSVLDLDFFTTNEQAKSVVLPKTMNSANAPDDIMVDISEPTTSYQNINPSCASKYGSPLHKMLEMRTTLESPKKEMILNNGTDSTSLNKINSEVKPLTDIMVTLQSVQPSGVPPIKAFEEENGVTVTLHFCKDKPRPDVYVIVISTTSKNSLPIEDYKLQAVVPKGCKVRLLQASGTRLPALNPFLPPAALTQIMLIARPRTSPPVNLKFVITYNCNEESYSEMGEVASLPLDDII